MQRMNEFLAGVRAALPGLAASFLVSGLVLHYLQRYIDRKLAEDETRRAEEHQRRRKRAQLEHQRRHTAGRLLFWLYKGVTKPPPNGELAEAMEAYQAAERAQKELEREILAEAETGGTT